MNRIARETEREREREREREKDVRRHRCIRCSNSSHNHTRTNSTNSAQNRVSKNEQWQYGHLRCVIAAAAAAPCASIPSYLFLSLSLCLSRDLIHDGVSYFTLILFSCTKHHEQLVFPISLSPALHDELVRGVTWFNSPLNSLPKMFKDCSRDFKRIQLPKHKHKEAMQRTLLTEYSRRVINPRSDLFKTLTPAPIEFRRLAQSLRNLNHNLLHELVMDLRRSKKFRNFYNGVANVIAGGRTFCVITFQVHDGTSTSRRFVDVSYSDVIDFVR